MLIEQLASVQSTIVWEKIDTSLLYRTIGWNHSQIRFVREKNCNLELLSEHRRELRSESSWMTNQKSHTIFNETGVPRPHLGHRKFELKVARYVGLQYADLVRWSCLGRCHGETPA